MLNADSTVYVRLKHIKRTLLGEPFTKCAPVKDSSSPYTERGCLEAGLPTEHNFDRESCGTQKQHKRYGNPALKDY